MTDQPGWYPPGQVCYPPELPTYLKNVYNLKPIIGAPSNEELIRIHDVVYAANRVSSVPGMHGPGLLMKLSDHLFSAQMARYRNRYSLVTFPSDATYTPPALPSHISVSLEPISGSPSDEEMIKAQDAVQSYQGLRRYPSMFDAHVNMELSQHLFDIQMARHMRCAGKSHPRLVPQVTEIFECPSRSEEQDPSITEERSPATNNAGTGMNAVGEPRVQLTTGIYVRELMEWSNKLTERLNQLLERSNELAECNNKASDPLAERFNQVFERFTQFVKQIRQPDEQSNSLVESFNQLFERFDQLVENPSQPAQRANELAERSNQLADRANQLAEQSSKHTERMGDVLKNVNKVLVGIQHAIVRSGKSNTVYAVDCLVNEQGQTPLEGLGKPFKWNQVHSARDPAHHLPIRVNGGFQDSYLYNVWLGPYLRLHGIGEKMRESATSSILKEGKEKEAREMLSDYLSSCLG